ncbi:MAG: hypothetical protein HYX26_08515 [Acidobacteriales bacterium]|nr:hypothetical protein [Terriglobales bacterium]
MNRRRLASTAFMLAALSLAAAQGLFQQSAAMRLKQAFNAPEISYLLLDARSGETLAQQWPDADKPIPLGSLVKPFTALAYRAGHSGAFPGFQCDGKQCWRPGGHGKIGLREAIAQSCNEYFRKLAAFVKADSSERIAHDYSIAPPPAGSGSGAMVGECGEWKISPMAMAHAYLRLLDAPNDPVGKILLAGMSESADLGTSLRVSAVIGRHRALAKTGTAPCTHDRHTPGDGFTIVMWPAEQPRYLLLVRLHGEPGSHAAGIAGRMVRTLEETRVADAD